MTLSFTLDIDPVAWQRVQRGRSGHAYVPGKTRAFENSIRMLARRHAPKTPLDGPLKLTARFILVPPKRRVRSEPCVRPDLDNFMKALKDGLSGVIWTDDSRVCRYGDGTGKYYAMDGSGSRIEITIEELP